MRNLSNNNCLFESRLALSRICPVPYRTSGHLLAPVSVPYRTVPSNTAGYKQLATILCTYDSLCVAYVLEGDGCTFCSSVLSVSCRQYINKKKINARDRQSQRRSQETSGKTSCRLQNARDRQSQRRSHSYAEDVTSVSH